VGFEAEVRINGLDRLLMRLGVIDLRTEQLMAQCLEEALLLIGGELGQYPAAVPGTRYVRTGLLGRQWGSARPQTWRVSLGVMRGRIENRRPGVEYVQSRAEQARVHRGRWKTAEEVIEGQADEIDRLLGVTGTHLVDWMAK